ncbi:hypothetical protein SUH3_07560 [Pseudosulfitobacter pseudonitzschiae]|uniref:Uncharacterized protein n=1 Tax=Pseudosulfitobacter pseudonitzschiae TaxID=1402135 RepID=A0A073IX88_9RHOB|nr:hypothetical protein SUH3_07560 [Pseudosulfitobacter pseudonitzschiae]
MLPTAGLNSTPQNASRAKLRGVSTWVWSCRRRQPPQRCLRLKASAASPIGRFRFSEVQGIWPNIP